MLDKEKLATLCQNIISAFADEKDSECIAKQKAFEINEGVPRIVGLCDDVIHAYTCAIDNGFFATVMRPQLNVTTRKELVDVAIHQLYYYANRHFSKYAGILCAVANLVVFHQEYLLELERTGNYQ